MRFVKIPAILSTVTNLGCIPNSKNIKNTFLKTFIFRVFFFTIQLRFHNAWFEKISNTVNSDFHPVFRGKLVFRERSSGVPQEIW